MIRNLFKAVVPRAWRVLKPRWPLLLLIPALGFISGVIPTWKSEIESALLQQTDRVLNARHENPSLQAPRISEILESPLERFQDSTAGSDEVTTRILYSILGGKNILWSFCFYAGLWLIAYLVTVGSTKIGAALSTEVYVDLRKRALANALRRGMAIGEMEPEAVGKTAWSISRGAEVVWSTVARFLPMLQVLILLLTALYIVGSKSWAAGAICFSAILIRAWLSRLQAKRLKSVRSSLEKTRDQLGAQTVDILENRDLIVIHEQTGRYLNKMSDLTTEYGTIDRQLSTSSTRYDNGATIVKDFGLLFLLFGVLVITLNGQDLRVIGDAYFFAALYRRLQEPASQLLDFYDSYRSDEAVVQTFLKVLDQDGQQAGGQVQEAAVQEHVIVFGSVSFSYGQPAPKEPKPVLLDCSFAVPRNKTTLLIGRSGCGKSTILRLAAGILKRQDGNIRVCGVTTSDWASEALHQQMSYGSQDTHVINETVRENLLWSCKEVVPDETLSDTLKRAGLSGIQLEQNAKTLSQGQQQRLAFARLLLDHSPILLLDEPFTGLDVFTLKELMPELTRFFKDGARTILMVSHRMNFAGFADHVVVVDDCRVVEEGKVKDLVADQGSRFGELYFAAKADFEVRELPSKAAGEAN